MSLALDYLQNIITSIIELDVSNDLQHNYDLKNAALELLWYAYCLLTNRGTQQSIALDALADTKEHLNFINGSRREKDMILEFIDEAINSLKQELAD